MSQGEEFDGFNQFSTERIFGLVEFLISVLDSQLEVLRMESGTRQSCVIQAYFIVKQQQHGAGLGMKEEP